MKRTRRGDDDGENNGGVAVGTATAAVGATTKALKSGE